WLRRPTLYPIELWARSYNHTRVSLLREQCHRDLVFAVSRMRNTGFVYENRGKFTRGKHLAHSARTVVMRAPGDRRAHVRFEVFGAFWGTFDAGDAVRVVDLTHLGALIETHQPLAVESIQSVCLTLDGQPALADARVRHMRASQTDAKRYLVGLEFLTTSTAFLDAVDRLMAYRAFPTETA
ncbi:MAG TPA: hypothetical protein VFZ38_10345, partial [Vicinamibacterales bacterium]